MSVEGIFAGQAAPLRDALGVRPQESVKGTFMGHDVEVAESPESLLADAAEELGFAVDATEDCEITERKEKEPAEASERLRKLYDVLMHQTGKSRAMARLLDSLRQAGNRRAMREALTKEFADVTDAWVALSAAQDELQKDPGVTAEQKNEIRLLAEEWLQENGTAVRLGLQGGVAGAEFSAVGFDAGRDLYRETVGEFSGVTEVFTEIKTKFGESFDAAMDFLFAAISADIASDVPSMGRPHLESVHEKLGLVRLTQSAYRLCGELVDRTRMTYHSRKTITATALLEDVLRWSQLAFLSPRDVTETLKKVSLTGIEEEVLFLQDLLATVRRFPAALFGDEAGQLKVTEAVQSAVDEAVAREDEYLAAQG